MPVSVSTVTAPSTFSTTVAALPGTRCAAASSLMPSSSISSRSLTRRTTIGPGSLFVSGTVGAPFARVLRTGDRVAVRAGGGVAEQLHELLLDVGRDRVLPTVGLGVHLLPLEADHVDQQALGEPVPAHDGGRERLGPCR